MYVTYSDNPTEYLHYAWEYGGPLTTAFTPPSWCLMPTFTRSSCYYDSQQTSNGAACTGQLYPDRCGEFESRSYFQSCYGSYQTQRGLLQYIYHPASDCPKGWYTAQTTTSYIDSLIPPYESVILEIGGVVCCPKLTHRTCSGLFMKRRGFCETTLAGGPSDQPLTAMWDLLENCSPTESTFQPSTTRSDGAVLPSLLEITAWGVFLAGHTLPSDYAFPLNTGTIYLGAITSNIDTGGSSATTITPSPTAEPADEPAYSPDRNRPSLMALGVAIGLPLGITLMIGSIAGWMLYRKRKRNCSRTVTDSADQAVPSVLHKQEAEAAPTAPIELLSPMSCNETIGTDISGCFTDNARGTPAETHVELPDTSPAANR